MFKSDILSAVLALTMVLPGAIMLANSYTDTKPSTKVLLYPYLNASGRYGYADAGRHLVIDASFRSASTFTHTGYAVVQSEQKDYGVIDLEGTEALPLDYNTVSLQLIGNHTLAITEQTYTSRSRFWEWRFLPGFSITGGSSDKRLFDTEVKRSIIEIWLVESRQLIYSERTATGSIRHSGTLIQPLDNDHFLIKDRLFKLSGKRAAPIATGIFGSINRPYLLQKKGSKYRIVDYSGSAVSPQRYRIADTLRTTIHGSALSIPVSSQKYSDVCDATVFTDDAGFQYIYPDFSKSFPQNINHPIDYLLSADTILMRTALISSMPGSDRFLLRWFHKETSRFEYPMIDTAGEWHMAPPPENTFTVVTPSGNIQWPGPATVIPHSILKPGEQISAYTYIYDQTYIVRVSSNGIEQMGVWNAGTLSWDMEPAYHYIGCLDFDKGYWSFKTNKDSLYGIYNTRSGQVIISPRYQSISANGMVTHRDPILGYISFYVDWQTQKEYRDNNKEDQY